MRIKRLTTADIPALIAIDRASFAADDQYGLPYYDEVIASNGFEAIGVEDDSKSVVAWALLDLRREPIRIRSLSVCVHYRRRKLATTLVREILVKHSGPVDLLVEPENRAAIALYEKLGFHVAEPDAELPQRVRMVRAG